MAKSYHYKKAKIHISKKWFVYYSYLHPSGKFKRIKIYGKGEIDINRVKDLDARLRLCEEIVADMNQLLENGFNPFDEITNAPLEAQKSWTVVQALNRFKDHLEDRGLRKKSKQTYESVLNMLYSLPSNIPVNDLTKEKCLTLIHHEAKKREWSNTTFNNNLRISKLIFSFLAESGIIEKNPFTTIKRMQETITRHKAFDKETLERIKQNAPHDLWRFIQFMYHTGSRVNDARQLKYENILRDRKQVFIPAHLNKSKRDRFIPVSDEFLKLFTGQKGLILGGATNYWGNKFAELKKELHLDKTHTLYSIKHTKALDLVAAGAKPSSIMQFFGHSSLEITMRYLRDIGATVDREAADMGKAI